MKRLLIGLALLALLILGALLITSWPRPQRADPSEPAAPAARNDSRDPVRVRTRVQPIAPRDTAAIADAESGSSRDDAADRERRERPALRADVDIATTDKSVALSASIRPTSPAADTARPVEIAITLDPVTSRLRATLGRRPDAGTVRTSGAWQLITHAPTGTKLSAGVVTFDSEFLKVNEDAGVVYGMATCMSSPRQSAGQSLGPDGEPRGHTTAWGRVRIAFEVDEVPYAATIFVPEFRDHRAMRLEIEDEGAAATDTGR